jgi:ribosomal protein L6P/L9E
MRKEKVIILPKNLKFSLAYVQNVKFIVITDSINIKYVLIPNFIHIEKNENLLKVFHFYINNKLKDSEFNQFINRFYFGLKNISTTFRKKLSLKGLGYKFNIQESLKNVELKLGLSHLINVKIPENIKIKYKKNFINIESKDNVLLGNFVNKIVALKTPDVYKGKGF